MTKPCNIENMKTFVNALYSGDYTQAKGSLRKETDDGSYTYCCLGVATDLAIKDGIDTTVHVMYGNIWGCGTLAPQVQEWLGIDNDNPMLDFSSEERMIATNANDAYGMDFYSIGSAFRRTYIPVPDGGVGASA